MLRAERVEDGPFLLALFREARGGMLSGLDPALADMLLRQQMAGQNMTYATLYPAARYEIVEQDSVPIGRMIVDEAAEAFTLVDIALLADWRGRGIGTRLIGGVLREAAAASVPVRLSVAIGNPAQRLYARLGFVVATTSEMQVEMVWPPP